MVKCIIKCVKNVYDFVVILCKNKKNKKNKKSFSL